MTTQLNESPVFDPGVELGAVVHDLMFRRRLSQTAMAGRLGINQSTLSKKLRGSVGITTSELFAIADILDTTPTAIIELVRARRDSNPKPSDLYLVQGGRAASAVRSILTADRPFRHLRAVAS